MWPWIDSRNRFRNDVVTGGSRFYLGMCMKILLKMQKIHGTHTVYYDWYSTDTCIECTRHECMWYVISGWYIAGTFKLCYCEIYYLWRLLYWIRFSWIQKWCSLLSFLHFTLLVRKCVRDRWTWATSHIQIADRNCSCCSVLMSLFLKYSNIIIQNSLSMSDVHWSVSKQMYCICAYNYMQFFSVE